MCPWIFAHIIVRALYFNFLSVKSGIFNTLEICGSILFILILNLSSDLESALINLRSYFLIYRRSFLIWSASGILLLPKAKVFKYLFTA